MSNNRFNPIPIAGPTSEEDFTPNPEGPELPPGFGLPTSELPRLPLPSWPPPLPHFCHLSLPQGCYQINFSNPGIFPIPRFGSLKFGTLRVEHSSGIYIISGDTYKYSYFDHRPALNGHTIPIFPRNKYKSYLKGTSVSIPTFSFGICAITLNLDEFDYTQPPSGFDGTFPASASRKLRIVLTPATPPSGYSGPYFTGKVIIGGILSTTVCTLAWVNKHYRRATIEVHTMTGAVAPAAVGTEYFNTVYANANWDLTVLTDPNPIPAPTVAGGFPAGWTGTSNWGSPSPGYALLHQVMTNLVDFASINLDNVWHMHVLLVQAAIGDGRGVMFDSINVPREGTASFCDDGYPDGDLSNPAEWGTARGHKQREIPRAFLRSASHEITHGFNMIHQENEAGSDNSIMTTSPGVAHFLATHGQSFPNDIFLGFNDHVRHHLIHWPDIATRPGGMTFSAGHIGTPPPSADEEDISEHLDLSLTLTSKKQRVKIGEPLHLSWELKNISDRTVLVPADLSIEVEFAEITVTNPNGDIKDMPPYVIQCDAGSFKELKPGQAVSAGHDLFWSPQGFAFDQPGKHRVEVTVSWGKDGSTIGASAEIEVFVDYPVSDKENEIIANMMHHDVGKFVALGGHAYHLKHAVKCIDKVMNIDSNHDCCKAMKAFYNDKHKSKKSK